MEFRERFLPAKIIEEARELADAKTKEQRMEELADLYEALEEYLAQHDISVTKVLRIQDKKRKEKGDFSKRTILIVGSTGGSI